MDSSTTKNAFSDNDILKSVKGELFGPDASRLPSPPMLMVDRITVISDSGGRYGKGELIAELDIKPDLWFFKCHFPGDPVMPGCLGLDAMWQLLGFHMAWLGHRGKGRALGVKEVKFTGQVLPTARCVSYHLHIRRMITRRLIMGIADGIMSVDGEDIYSADGLRVGFFHESNTVQG